MTIAALAVPDAAPRCDGSAVAKIAETKAGVLIATPTSAMTAPRIRPGGEGHAAARRRPAASAPRAAAEGERRHTVGDARDRDPSLADRTSVDGQRETSRSPTPRAPRAGRRRRRIPPIARTESRTRPGWAGQGGGSGDGPQRRAGALNQVPDDHAEAGREDGQCCGAGPGHLESDRVHQDVSERWPEGDAEVQPNTTEHSTTSTGTHRHPRCIHGLGDLTAALRTRRRDRHGDGRSSSRRSRAGRLSCCGACTACSESPTEAVVRPIASKYARSSPTSAATTCHSHARQFEKFDASFSNSESTWAHPDRAEGSAEDGDRIGV